MVENANTSPDNRNARVHYRHYTFLRCRSAGVYAVCLHSVHERIKVYDCLIAKRGSPL